MKKSRLIGQLLLFVLTGMLTLMPTAQVFAQETAESEEASAQSELFEGWSATCTFHFNSRADAEMRYIMNNAKMTFDFGRNTDSVYFGTDLYAADLASLTEKMIFQEDQIVFQGSSANQGEMTQSTAFRIREPKIDEFLQILFRYIGLLSTDDTLPNLGTSLPDELLSINYAHIFQEFQTLISEHVQSVVKTQKDVSQDCLYYRVSLDHCDVYIYKPSLTQLEKLFSDLADLIETDPYIAEACSAWEIYLKESEGTDLDLLVRQLGLPGTGELLQYVAQIETLPEWLRKNGTMIAYSLAINEFQVVMAVQDGIVSYLDMTMHVADDTMRAHYETGMIENTNGLRRFRNMRLCSSENTEADLEYSEIAEQQDGTWNGIISLVGVDNTAEDGKSEYSILYRYEDGAKPSRMLIPCGLYIAMYDNGSESLKIEEINSANNTERYTFRMNRDSTPFESNALFEFFKDMSLLAESDMALYDEEYFMRIEISDASFTSELAEEDVPDITDASELEWLLMSYALKNLGT